MSRNLARLAGFSSQIRDATAEALARMGSASGHSRKGSPMGKKPKDDKAAQDAVEGRTGASRGTRDPSERTPTAGPHADPGLVNPDATPGAGALQPPGENDDGDSTSS